MLTTEGAGASHRVGECIEPVLVQRVEATAGPACRGGDVLVFPPAVDETERAGAAQRSVDGDLLDAQAVRDLEPVELGRTVALDPQTLEQDLRVELEQETSAGSGHHRSNFRRAITP